MPEFLHTEVKLTEDNVKWYRESFPGMPLSLILDLLLRKYREVTTKTPADYAELAAKALRGSNGSESNS